MDVRRINGVPLSQVCIYQREFMTPQGLEIRFDSKFSFVDMLLTGNKNFYSVKSDILVLSNCRTTSSTSFSTATSRADF